MEKEAEVKVTLEEEKQEKEIDKKKNPSKAKGTKNNRSNTKESILPLKKKNTKCDKKPKTNIYSYPNKNKIIKTEIKNHIKKKNVFKENNKSSKYSTHVPQ